MKKRTDAMSSSAYRATANMSRRRGLVELAVFAVAMAVTIWSAIAMKSLDARSPIMLASPSTAREISVNNVARQVQRVSVAPALATASTRTAGVASQPTPDVVERPLEATAADIRWFDGKAMRPAKTLYMKVTGYSPDAASCAPFDDGYTATMKSVWTNGMRLVAADPKVLPMHTLISVPGYHNGEIVPVLDKGGAIKGSRLDVLYPTHKRARQWGVQWLTVTVWEPVENER